MFYHVRLGVVVKRRGNIVLKSIVKGFVLLSIGLIFAVGCQAKEEPSAVKVSAAASLQDVLEELKTAYKEEKALVDIEYNFGSAGSLQQQIEQGATTN